MYLKTATCFDASMHHHHHQTVLLLYQSHMPVNMQSISTYIEGVKSISLASRQYSQCY
jgi:hypothetical protein